MADTSYQRKPHADDDSRLSKRRKSSAVKAEGREKTLPVRKMPKVAKTPKAKKRNDISSDIPSSDRRRSSRHSLQKNYVEQDDSEDEAELEQWNQPGKASNNDDADDDDDDDDDNDDDGDDGSRFDSNRRTFSARKAKSKPKLNGHGSKIKGKRVTASRKELSDSSRSGDGLSQLSESEQSE